MNRRLIHHFLIPFARCIESSFQRLFFTAQFSTVSTGREVLPERSTAPLFEGSSSSESGRRGLARAPSRLTASAEPGSPPALRGCTIPAALGGGGGGALAREARKQTRPHQRSATRSCGAAERCRNTHSGVIHSSFIQFK